MGVFLLVLVVTVVVFVSSAIYEVEKWSVYRKVSKIFTVSFYAFILEMILVLILLGISAFVNL